MSGKSDMRYHADCALCGTRRGGDGARQEGATVPDWGLWICNKCRLENHDGIVPESNGEFIAKLRARGVPLTLNAIGWLVIPK